MQPPHAVCYFDALERRQRQQHARQRRDRTHGISVSKPSANLMSSSGGGSGSTLGGSTAELAAYSLRKASAASMRSGGGSSSSELSSSGVTHRVQAQHALLHLAVLK